MIHKLQRKSFVSLLIVLFVLAGTASSTTAWPGKKKKKQRVEQTSPVLPPAAEVAPAPPPKPAANGSLFTDSAPGSTLVTNFKAQRVGDLVFIDVVETSSATVSSSATRARESGTLGGLTGVVSALPISGAAAISGAITGLGQRKYEGKGATARQSSVKSRITARVVEVLPNGDLRIAASKMVKINKEDETLSLSGIVRQRDVSADNAIPSTAVGDLKLALNGKGVASADNQPGWLFRLIDKISPF